jgi:hypothetical protein
MKIELEIEDRQYNDFETYCKANNLDIHTYLTDLLVEKHSINKFGDLNEIIPKVIEESTVTVKKRSKVKKSDDENKTKAVEEEIKNIPIVEENTTEDVAEESEDTIVKPTVVKKRKRTLKTL